MFFLRIRYERCIHMYKESIIAKCLITEMYLSLRDVSMSRRGILGTDRQCFML